MFDTGSISSRARRLLRAAMPSSTPEYQPVGGSSSSVTRVFVTIDDAGQRCGGL